MPGIPVNQSYIIWNLYYFSPFLVQVNYTRSFDEVRLTRQVVVKKRFN